MLSMLMMRARLKLPVVLSARGAGAKDTKRLAPRLRPRLASAAKITLSFRELSTTPTSTTSSRQHVQLAEQDRPQQPLEAEPVGD